jgi:hypothetical protein
MDSILTKRCREKDSAEAGAAAKQTFAYTGWARDENVFFSPKKCKLNKKKSN